MDRFSKFFYWLIREKILYNTYKDFHLTCNMLLLYLIKFENPKTLQILTASATNC